MTYEFEWDANKATTKHNKHGVSFHEASTVFADPLAMLLRDPDHSLDEERYLVLGTSSAGKLLIVTHTERPPRTPDAAPLELVPVALKVRHSPQVGPSDQSDADPRRLGPL